MNNEIVARYVAGESAPVIAASLGVSSNFVYRCLDRLGIKRRTTGEGKKARLDLVEIRRLYDAGETVASLARCFSVGFGTMRRHLVEAGAEMRPNSWNRHDDKAGEIQRLYLEDRLSLDMIAARFGVHPATVHRYLRLAGVEMRPDSSIQVFDHVSPCAGAIAVRGTWEKAYAQVLDIWHSRGLVIDWQYESDRVDISKTGAGV